MKKYYFYVYKITNLVKNHKRFGHIYIGSRVSSRVIPELDLEYMGSSRMLSNDIKKFGKEKFKKEILEEFATKEEAWELEKKLVTWEFCLLENTYNKAVPYGAPGYNYINERGELVHTTTKRVVVKDINGKQSLISQNDSRYLSGELISIFKGKILAKDKNNKNIWVEQNDPRWISGELVGIAKGKSNVKNEAGEKFQIDKNDPRFLSGELVGVNKNKILAKDKLGKIYQIDKNDPRWISGELVGVNKNRVHVKDEHGNKFWVDKNDPRFLSGELVGSRKGIKFKKSTLH